jgi:hypothetical protein
MLRILLVAVAATCLFADLAEDSVADNITVMDQIGPNPSFVDGRVAYTSQIFEPIYSVNNIAMLDNFSITRGPLQLVEVDAVLKGFQGFTSYSNVTDWQVAIYSSPTAAVRAGTSLNGDVFNDIIAPSAVTLTTPYTSLSTSALLQIPITETLSAGTYDIAVMAIMPITTGGVIGVYSSAYPGTPSDFNAMQVNPGGFDQFPGDIEQTGQSAAYRILAQSSAVPEPPSLSLAIAAIGLFSVWIGHALKTATRDKPIQNDDLELRRDPTNLCRLSTDHS